MIDTAEAKKERSLSVKPKVFFAKFPKAKLIQCNYDVPCESFLCEATIVKQFIGGAYCGDNKHCQDLLGVYWGSVYVGELQKRYAQPQYTGLNIFGTFQEVNGNTKASPEFPDLDSDAGDCGITSNIMCIHPAYGTKMSTAIGEQFWKQFFGKHVTASIGVWASYIGLVISELGNFSSKIFCLNVISCMLVHIWSLNHEQK